MKKQNDYWNYRRIGPRSHTPHISVRYQELSPTNQGFRHHFWRICKWN